MKNFFKKFKKSCFWPIFPIFRAKSFFPENLPLSCTTSNRFLPPCQNLEKANDTITRIDRKMDRPYLQNSSGY